MRAFLSPQWSPDGLRRHLEIQSTDSDTDPGCIVLPHVLPLSGVDGAFTVTGYPTGAHHGLVKASEARLAIQHGAEGVFYVPLPTAIEGDSYAAVSEAALMREAVPSPAILGVCLPMSPGELANGGADECLRQVLALGIGVICAPFANEADVRHLVGIVRQAKATSATAIEPQILAPGAGQGEFAGWGISIDVVTHDGE